MGRCVRDVIPMDVFRGLNELRGKMSRFGRLNVGKELDRLKDAISSDDYAYTIAVKWSEFREALRQLCQEQAEITRKACAHTIQHNVIGWEAFPVIIREDAARACLNVWTPLAIDEPLRNPEDLVERVESPR